MNVMEESYLSLAIQHIEFKIKDGCNASERVKCEAKSLLTVLTELNELIVGAERRPEVRIGREARRLLGELRSILYNAEDEVDTLVDEYSSALHKYLGLGDIRALMMLRRLKKRAQDVKSKLQRLFHVPNNGLENPRDQLPAAGDEVVVEHLALPNYLGLGGILRRLKKCAQEVKSKLMQHFGKPAAGDEVVVGIDKEILQFVDLLTRNSKNGQRALDKLAFVGMGGCGKTTFARRIYNHKIVQKHFQFRAWVSVSQGLETYRLLHEDVHRQFYTELHDEYLEDDDGVLAARLNNILRQGNCLLVFDGVWDFKPLHSFILSIQGCGYRSQVCTIIITSRRTPFSNHTNTSNHISWYIHQPQRLLNEHCWKLFNKVASNSSEPPSDDYRVLAMELLTRCQGLPLAIVELARLLKTKKTVSEWQRVLSRITDIDGVSTYAPVKKILGPSYDHLPHYLKPCFLYLGLFPKGSDISRALLIRRWIAEGFVESSSEETLDVAGTRYLQELIDHTMVQVVTKTSSGKVKYIKIHDIMRDFCIQKARDLGFLATSGYGPQADGNTSRRDAVDLSENLNLSANNAHLRTLALFEKSSTEGVLGRHNSQANRRYVNLASVCQRYQSLRVLDIFEINSIDGTLPREIGNLIHLAYLRIRSTNIGQLPKAIGKLRNLLTLDYWDVHTDSEVEVPNVLWKLKRLRHLYLPNEMSGSVEALKLDTLKDLITLWGVGGGEWMLKESEKLSSTLSKLYIHSISDENQLKAVLDCTAMEENDNLYALALDWYGFEIMRISVLASKQNLRKLRLIGKAPDRLSPQGHRFPSKLEKLELSYTQLEKPETMTHLGKLIRLKVLILSKDSYIGSEWICDREAFPVLEELKLANLQKLEEWKIEEGAMRRLKKLSIIACIELNRIPRGLVHVRRLEKLDVKDMPSTFTTKLQEANKRNKTREGEDFHIIKHISKVEI